METHLRLKFRKLRYRLGYEARCARRSDSIACRRFAGSRWRRRCRTPPVDEVDDSLRCGCGGGGLNKTLLTKAKLVRTSKLRTDTT